jgi:hypothetical protein
VLNKIKRSLIEMALLYGLNLKIGTQYNMFKRF